MSLDYNEIFKFMRGIDADYLNPYGEIIIDEKSNTYAIIKDCETIEDVKMRVVFALCRPIGKGLEERPAKRLLKNLNKYFETELSRADMRLIYQELCYSSKQEEFKDFIKRGFPIKELEESK